MKAPTVFLQASGSMNCLGVDSKRRFWILGVNPYPADRQVRVTLRDGSVLEDAAGAFDWTISQSDADIVRHEDVRT